MNLELRDLRSFVAVAEELHFSRAAKRLNVAQPALSHQIKQLEQRLNVQLFRRTSRSVALTAAGAALLEGARRTLVEASRAADAAVRADRGEMESLRLGFTDAAALSFLSGAIRRFRAAEPEVHIDLREDSTRAQIESVERGTTDIALVSGPVSNPAVRTEVLLREPYVVALPLGHKLSHAKRVPIRSLARESIVLFPRHLAPGHYDAIAAVCESAGFRLDAKYEGAEYHTILSLVHAGLGVSIASASIRNLQLTGVVYRPLSGTRAVTQVVAVWRADHRSRVSAFLSAARSAADDS